MTSATTPVWLEHESSYLLHDKLASLCHRSASHGSRKSSLDLEVIDFCWLIAINNLCFHMIHKPRCFNNFVLVPTSHGVRKFFSWSSRILKDFWLLNTINVVPSSLLATSSVISTCTEFWSFTGRALVLVIILDDQTIVISIIIIGMLTGTKSLGTTSATSTI